MILCRLVLENFRQFYGVQELVFDHSSSKNVCVVYATNGAGKTTLLNAFTWVLYDTLSADFQNHDRLVNNQAWDECENNSSVKVSVQLQFDHDERRYTIRKDHEVRKVDGKMQVAKEGELSPLFYIDSKTGEQGQLQNPKVAIDQILPKRLHTFFFFNGERIEHLAKTDAYAEIEAAIKILLGLEILDRGQRHLEGAIGVLQQKLKKIGNIESQILIDDIDALKERREDLVIESKRLDKLIKSWEETLEAIDEKLKKLEITWKIQTERESLENRRRESLDDDMRIHNMINEKLNQQGFLGFLAGLSEDTEKVIEENRRKGEIPSLYKRQFVMDRLSEGRCICGTELYKGGYSYNQVEKWLERGGITGVEETFMGLGGFANSFDEQSRGLYHDLIGYSQQLENNRKLQSAIDERLDELSEQISGLPKLNIDENENPIQLEAERKKANTSIKGTNGDLQRVLYEIEILEDSIKGKERELEGVKEASDKAELAHRRVTIATEVRDILIDVHRIRTQDVRVELDRDIKDVFGRIAFKNYDPALSDDFQLSLYDQSGNSVARSTGENQILSLSFVGALANIARKQAKLNRKQLSGYTIGFKGGTYPVVIDAAFGQLDENYRKYVARILPELTDQIIIFVSKSQGLGPVKEELEHRIAKEFVIHFETTKQDAREESLDLRGESYPYITHSNVPNDRATIIEIKR